ncbi:MULTISPECIES: flagellar hook-basal body complex protein FliE [Methylobacterium]|jgi:flagellar hook-basal body complex protein FliE|uniref:Flagellar hook-basal body complex protein FliE n=1 Tax=Methylobacterium longum TaxID=767694 RepID=A0ABT8AKE2_9HYPH|nr:MULTISPECIES: flagellar hook-basal body complex protein FliE [Methylobacterium]MCJ2102497.1 flagellar hook-basal body complex protein FliE [Methylobacterium sp. E-046]MDN3570285.1 flagellar hook-basal body complex protein FliE [Methylobacterium longum]GJE11282.1 Flagellar hook-basal body complex protein FliE [Methylobacterium longum]
MASSNFAAGAYAAVQGLASGRPTPRVQPASEAGGDFKQFLGQTLDSVGDAGRRADAQAVSAASGKANVVDVVTAVAESETALQTMVAVRDRMISAYEEIMRMQI